MDGKYIFALVILGIFFLLILVSFAFLEYARRKEEKLQNWISERYSNKDLNKLDYDTVLDDEEVTVPATPEVTEDIAESTQETVDDTSDHDGTYDKIDVEGIEEITGNYNGDK